MRSTIKALLYEWKKRELPEMVERDTGLGVYLKPPRKIIAVSGFRRVGKTYASFLLIKKLLEKMGREEVVYINFEDERIPRDTAFLTEILPTIREVFSKEPKILFLDEVQSMPEWSRWLRRVYDSTGMYIFVTGSSSKLSAREIPTELRGRFMDIRLFPLSFREFLAFKGVHADPQAASYSMDERAKVFKALSEYLEFGGLPEVALANSADIKRETLQNYYRTVVSRDIAERFKVRNEEGLKAVLSLLLNSTHYSVSMLYRTLKSIGFTIGKTTVLEYISHAEDSFFLYSLPVFSRKAKDQMQHPRKAYFIDTGFITALSTKPPGSMGRLYENAVFLELKRRQKSGSEVYYWKNPQQEEVDFVQVRGAKAVQLVQVCIDPTGPETHKRETRALLKAAEELECKDLLVITESLESSEKAKGKTIHYIPLWKWLLGPMAARPL